MQLSHNHSYSKFEWVTMLYKLVSLSHGYSLFTSVIESKTDTSCNVILAQKEKVHADI